MGSILILFIGHRNEPQLRPRYQPPNALCLAAPNGASTITGFAAFEASRKPGADGANAVSLRNPVPLSAS